MKIKFYSDLHIDINKINNPASLFKDTEKADLYIDAGDTGNLASLINFYSNPYWEDKRVILIAGNHLCYGTKTPLLEAIEELKDKFPKKNNITFLQDSTIKIGDYTILGTTLWTNFKIFKNKEYCIRESVKYLNDYKYIKYSDSEILNPEITMNMNKYSIRYIKNNIYHNLDKKFIIVTHHTPSIQSALLKYRNDPITSAFCNEYMDFIEKYTKNIPIWIHGHVHNICNYNIKDTQVMCNPLGYIAFNEQSGFKNNRDIDI